MRRQKVSTISRRGIAAFGMFLFVTAARCVAAPGASNAGRGHGGESPVLFEKSKADQAPIQYIARSRSYDLYISREEADVVLHGGLERSGEAERGKVIVVHAFANVLRMRFVDANLPASVEARPNAQHAAHELVYRGIYPGTDVVLRANRGRIAFQLELSPGADARDVLLELSGATSINLDSRGNAVVHAGRESIVLQRPTAKIEPSANGELIPGGYEIEGRDRVRFTLSSKRPEASQTIAD